MSGGLEETAGESGFSSRPSLSGERERKASRLGLFVGFEEDPKKRWECPSQLDDDKEQIVDLFFKESTLDFFKPDAERFPGDLV